MLDSYTASVLALAALNALLALGLYLTMLSGQVSAAHSALAGITGYASGWLEVQHGFPPGLAIAAGILAATAIGTLLAYPAMRLRGLFLAIATLGFSSAVAVVIINIPALGGPAGFAGLALIVGPGTIFIVFGLVTVWFIAFEGSLTALAFRAVRDNEMAAAASGISIRGMRVLAFGLGAFFAAVSGALTAHYSGLVTTTDFGFGPIAQSITYVGLGGSDAFLGPIAGAGFYSLLPEVLRFTSDDRLIIFAAVAIVVIRFRPRGLITRSLMRKLSAPGRSRRRHPKKEDTTMDHEHTLDAAERSVAHPTGEGR